MSDAGAIGVAIHDIAMLLSKKYYNMSDEDKTKSHIGFNLVFLKDLVNIIQMEHGVDLYLENNLSDIDFFKNEDEELDYLKKQLEE